jgi:uncharacterized protein (TIGR03083 family)
MLTADRATTTGPRRSALDREVAMRLAATEYARFLDQLRALSPEDWTARTACPAWDVRALATHVLGMAEFSASLRVQAHQMRATREASGPMVDALTELQVRERAAMTPAQAVARLADVGPRAARGRRRTPGFVRRMTLPAEQTAGAGAPPEQWTFGFLVDVILTRDTWMHRVDVARATGRELVLTSDHDGVLVDDIVREWAGRHGQPCRLELTGPAGGSWTFGDGGEVLTADALAFCRSLSGRDVLPGLLGAPVPF